MDGIRYRQIYEKMNHCMAIKPADICHDQHHCMRVLYMALKLSQDFEALDQDVLIAAALLHDIGRSVDSDKSHCAVGAEMAYGFLIELGFNEEKALHVKDCIKTHSFSKGKKPYSIEAQILFDADKLDLTGAMGIGRTIQFGTMIQEPFYQLDKEEKIITAGEESRPSYIYQHNHRLKNTGEGLFTPMAKKIFQSRLRIMDEYYNALCQETTEVYETGKKIIDDINL